MREVRRLNRDCFATLPPNCRGSQPSHKNRKPRQKPADFCHAATIAQSTDFPWFGMQRPYYNSSKADKGVVEISGNAAAVRLYFK
jgi:hypothetical protein